MGLLSDDECLGFPIWFQLILPGEQDPEKNYQTKYLVVDSKAFCGLNITNS